MKKICTIILIGLLHSGLSADFAFDLRRAQRRVNAHTIKSEVGRVNEEVPLAIQLMNGDEQTYADKRGSFNKALKHKDDCYPDTAAFAALVKALDSGSNADFNAIPMGGTVRLHSPQASLAFSLDGNDGWIRTISPAPAFGSAQAASEMVENYWSALIRDVKFDDFGTGGGTDSDGYTTMAVTDLNTMSDFRGPKVNGAVTIGTLLRGNTAGDLVGPYISQFLYLDVPMGPYTIEQQINPPTVVNFMKTSATVKNILNGNASAEANIMYGTARYIITPRDLTEYVHKDFPCSGGMNAGLILQGWVSSVGTQVLDANHPYLNNPTQTGFVTYGITELMALVEEASFEAMKAAWYQKWQVNRRLRPEEFGFYVNEQQNGAKLGIHGDLMNSPVLSLMNTAGGTNMGGNGVGAGYFLNQAYREGCPPHPAYPAGHATFIGAGVTILKAWFNEDYEIPQQTGTSPNTTRMTVTPNTSGSALIGYTGDTLTIGGELNKLASNIAIGRDIAGVHYRSDGWDGMLLGEKIAIDVLNNYGYLFNEDFKGFSLTTFEGNKIIVGAKQAVQ